MSRVRPEDQAAIDAFIAKKGVTKLPPSGSPELAKHYAEQDEARRAAGPNNSRFFGQGKKPASPKSVETARATAEKKRGIAGKFTVKPAPIREIGPRPELAWLPLAKLKVDRSYQRNMDKSHVNRLASGFAWAAFKPLTVTPGDFGGWWVVDGQHEAEAARLVGVDEVPCMIVATSTSQAAAAAFVAMNKNRKAITGVDLYYGALVAKEPWALQIERLLKDAKLGVCRNGLPKPMETKSISSLKVLCKRVGGESVKRMLAIIGTVWPSEPKAFRERPMLSIARLIATEPGMGDDRIVKYLRSMANSYQFERVVWAAAETWASEPAVALARLIRGEKARAA